MHIEADAYQAQLVRTLQAADPSFAAKIIQAFSVTPRHPFVDHYYLPEEAGSHQWIRYEQGDSADWYKRVYQNDALVTQVDQYGRMLSSSSQPEVMAYMLQALDVEPGMRILEIGTGSGYNAALLAHLTGDPGLVTTVDLNADLVERAKRVIPRVVGKEGMTMVQADGRDGYPPNAPYDRIILTASAPTLPSALLNQLAPHGIVVGVLQPPFTMRGGLLKAQKEGEKLTGRILATASFMELRSAPYPQRPLHVDFHAPLFASFPFDALLFQPQALRDNHDFAFFLYYDVPDLSVFQKEEALFFYQEASPQGYALFRQQPSLQVELRGDAAIACSLWNRLVRAYSFWDRVGQPSIAQYAFDMDERGQVLSLPISSGVFWPFGMR